VAKKLLKKAPPRSSRACGWETRICWCVCVCVSVSDAERMKCWWPLASQADAMVRSFMRGTQNTGPRANCRQLPNVERGPT